jgi:exodeoxyribonuclease V alpha subunit
LEGLGDNAADVLSNDPKKIAEVAKIKLDVAKKIQKEWNEMKDKNLAYTELMKFSLSLGQAQKIYAALGDKSIQVVQSNPYAIIDLVDRVGFLTIDKIAVANGIKKDSTYRIKACIDYALKQEEGDGNSCTTMSRMNVVVQKLLCCESIELTKKVDRIMTEMIEDFRLMQIKIGSPEKLGFKNIIANQNTYHMEKNIFDLLEEHVQENSIDNYHLERAEKRIRHIAPTLNSNQLKAATLASISSCVITGGAGTGKTFTIQSIIEGNPNKHFSLCAPTGKAARRMEQSLQGEHASQFEPKTIHRLLEYNPETQSFQYDKWNKLETDFLIVDEFSMVDVYLAYCLLSAVDPTKTKIIMVGDHNQLPSIGCGNVLRDVIDHDLLPVEKLETVMRQGGVLKDNCNRILDGKVEDTKKDDETMWVVSRKEKDSETLIRSIMKMYVNKRFEENGFDEFSDVQIISPQRKGALGTVELNKKLQQYFQKKNGTPVDLQPEGKKYKIYKGDKVIQTKNDYKIDIMNGTLGIVKKVEYGNPMNKEDGATRYENANHRYYEIEFETGQTKRIKTTGEKSQNIDLAYALTIHKVQGSEFPCVIVVCHKLHNFMHHRGLLYTAATRAKKSLVILGDRWGVSACAKLVKTEKRKTLLPVFNALRRDENKVVSQ